MNENLAQVMPKAPEGQYWEISRRNEFHPGAAFEVRLVKDVKVLWWTKREIVWSFDLRNGHDIVRELELAKNSYLRSLRRAEQIKRFTS